MDKRQVQIDEVIASWRKDPGVFVSGDEAVRQFEGLVEFGEEWTKLAEVVSYDFTPKHANALEEFGVDENRVAELANGAEPTEEEVEFWQSAWKSLNDFFEVVVVYKLTGSNSSSAYFTLTEEGAGGTLLDGSGPYFDTESLIGKLVEKVCDWDDWWVASSAPGSESLLALLEQELDKAH